MHAHTTGPWRLAKDAQGPCMIMHPKRAGVAIASLTAKGMPKNGFLDSQEGEDAETSLAERNANARLVVASPELFDAAMAVIAHHKAENPNVADWPEALKSLTLAVAKVGVGE